MLTKLIINDVDFAPWVKPGGMTQSTIFRRQENQVTADGILHRVGYEKRAISVELVTMRDDSMNTLFAALTSPATVRYTDRSGEERTGTFYVSDPVATVKMIRQGVTYWEGIGFTLEER